MSLNRNTSENHTVQLPFSLLLLIIYSGAGLSRRSQAYFCSQNSNGSSTDLSVSAAPLTFGALLTTCFFAAGTVTGAVSGCKRRSGDQRFAERLHTVGGGGLFFSLIASLREQNPQAEEDALHVAASYSYSNPLPGVRHGRAAEVQQAPDGAPDEHDHQGIL